MRPGQAAPEFGVETGATTDQSGASMRPGQAAPEFVGLPVAHEVVNKASMRPGQAAPEFPLDQRGNPKNHARLQ